MADIIPLRLVVADLAGSQLVVDAHRPALMLFASIRTVRANCVCLSVSGRVPPAQDTRLDEETALIGQSLGGAWARRFVLSFFLRPAFCR